MRVQRVLTDNLGSNWRSHFLSFDMHPFAAASIGQVHRAVLSPDSPFAAQYPASLELAVKVQFPGVRDSISGDIKNLRWLLVASAALPRGLYLDNTLRVLERELDDECDYEREAACGSRMRALILDSPLREHFDVPRVVPELSGPMVLTTEMMQGQPLKDVLNLEQDDRDWVSFVCFSFLPSNPAYSCCGIDRIARAAALPQRDPPFQDDANRPELEQLPLQSAISQSARSSLFLSKSYADLRDPCNPQLELIDFGATREYSTDFVTTYRQLLQASIEEDQEAAIRLSRELGYLTGDENQVRLQVFLRQHVLADPSCSRRK